MKSLAIPEREFIVRQAIKEDGIGILELIKKSFLSYVHSDKNSGNVRNPALEEDLIDVYNDIEENIVLVIEDGSDIIGSLRLIEKEEGVYYLKRFAILPFYQHQGLGTRLFYAAEEEVLNIKGKYIYLHSSLESEILKSFYYRLGFSCIEIDNTNGYKRGLWIKHLQA
jgi:N-acetylglutamate synthase-like GNAT family acetyltransferase